MRWASVWSLRSTSHALARAWSAPGHSRAAGVSSEPVTDTHILRRDAVPAHHAGIALNVRLECGRKAGPRRPKRQCNQWEGRTWHALPGEPAGIEKGLLLGG